MLRVRSLSHRCPRARDPACPEVSLNVRAKHWDDLLRVAGSMKRGYVTASLFIGKLKSYRRQNMLTLLRRPPEKRQTRGLRATEDEPPC
ncbi:MAG TPA: Tn3 family transposase [Anaeromyxobacteraceae bacterium]|nr:Tn3 family transposase [Anaeromyxobacteraceae bacterium]